MVVVGGVVGAGLGIVVVLVGGGSRSRAHCSSRERVAPSAATGILYVASTEPFAGMSSVYWTIGSARTTTGWGSNVMSSTDGASVFGITSVNVARIGVAVGFSNRSRPVNSVPPGPSSFHTRATCAPSGVVMGSNASRGRTRPGGEVTASSESDGASTKAAAMAATTTAATPTSATTTSSTVRAGLRRAVGNGSGGRERLGGQKVVRRRPADGRGTRRTSPPSGRGLLEPGAGEVVGLVGCQRIGDGRGMGGSDRRRGRSRTARAPPQDGLGGRRLDGCGCMNRRRHVGVTRLQRDRLGGNEEGRLLDDGPGPEGGGGHEEGRFLDHRFGGRGERRGRHRDTGAGRWLVRALAPPPAVTRRAGSTDVDRSLGRAQRIVVDLGLLHGREQKTLGRVER